MKNLTKLFAFAVVIFGFSATSFGQIVAPGAGTLTARATVNPIAAITNATDLNFGAIGSDANGGTVIIPTVGTRSGTAVLLTGGNEAPGGFDVTASAGNIVNVVMPSGATVLTTGVGGAGRTMTINSGAWNFKIGTNADNATYTMPALATSVAVKIGATLNVGANQVVGAYVGTYAITVSLQ
jgi:hypothetical protein